MTMKKILLLLVSFLTIVSGSACSNDNVTPKSAVIICPGGAFQFRSVQSEGYNVANMLVPMGYQCFVVNYRISPYTMRESTTDLQRAICYVRAHAYDYREQEAIEIRHTTKTLTPL